MSRGFMLVLTIVATAQMFGGPVVACESTGVASSRLPTATHSARHVMFLAGNKAGYQSIRRQGSETRVHFEFNDRGRGPKLDARIVVDSRGIPTLIETVGNNYGSSPVNERFELSDNRASWANAAENGEIRADSAGFYVSLESVPEESAILARALLQSPNQRLRIFPEGQAKIERIGALEVTVGKETETVVQYVVSGLDLSPSQIWLDSQGEMFARVNGPFQIVREGWDEVLPILASKQEEWTSIRQREMVARLVKVPSTPVAFTGALLFDASEGRMIANTTVVVSGQRIVEVGPDADVVLPPDAHVIELRGKALLPGLWDMHAHVRNRDGPLNIAAGVTSVRDLANQIEPLIERRRRWEMLEAIGPRVVMAGIIDGKGPVAAPTTVLVGSPEEARAAVDRYAQLGYPQVKIYSSVNKELVPVIIERALSHKMRVSGHIPGFMTAEQAIGLGFKEIHHINMLFLNFLGDTFDSRSAARFTALADLAPTLDLTSDRVTAFINMLVEHDIVVDPTLSVFEGMFTARPGTIAPQVAAVADRFPPLVRRGYLSGGRPAPGDLDAKHRAVFDAALRMVARLHRAGVRVVAGTDAIAGFTLHRELELYVRAGIPANEVLLIATRQAAEVAGYGDQLGVLAPGYLADMIVVDGNPVADISKIRRVESVMKNGVLYDPVALYRELSVIPWQESGDIHNQSSHTDQLCVVDSLDQSSRTNSGCIDYAANDG